MSTVASTLESDRPLAVLNGTLAERLDLVNGVKRALGEGYKIVRQELHLGTDKRPVVILGQGDEALRKRLTLIKRGRDQHGRYVVGRLHEVDVRYPEAEPQSFAELVEPQRSAA